MAVFNFLQLLLQLLLLALSSSPEFMTLTSSLPTTRRRRRRQRRERERSNKWRRKRRGDRYGFRVYLNEKPSIPQRTLIFSFFQGLSSSKQPNCWFTFMQSTRLSIIRWPILAPCTNGSIVVFPRFLLRLQREKIPVLLTHTRTTAERSLGFASAEWLQQ